MSVAGELAELFRRDLTRLIQELQAFPDEATLWRNLSGVNNSGGNLTLHLEGNLRECIGRQLGNVPYNRQRDSEFTAREVPVADLIQRIESLKELIPNIVAGLSQTALESTYPEKVFAAPFPRSSF